MFHHRKHSVWERFVMALRDVRTLARTSIDCPGGCGPVVGDNSSWYCPKCNGSGGQG